jgi:hypothetical protein
MIGEGTPVGTLYDTPYIRINGPPVRKIFETPV